MILQKKLTQKQLKKNVNKRKNSENQKKNFVLKILAMNMRTI